MAQSSAKKAKMASSLKIGGVVLKTEFQIKKELFETMLENFICNGCKVIPRYGSIFQSITGKNGTMGNIVCENCFPKNSKNFQRNLALENTLYAFPMTTCKFRKNGCNEIRDMNGIDGHEEICLFRAVQCPFNECEAMVSFNDLENHMKANDEYDIKKNCDEISIQGTKVFCEDVDIDLHDDDVTRVTLHFTINEKLFLIHVEYQFKDKSNMKFAQIWVQIYGSGNEAKKYMCSINFGELEIYGEDNYSWKGPVKSLDDKKSEMFKEKFGLIIPFQSLKKFLDSNQSFDFEINIYDLDQKMSVDQEMKDDPINVVENTNDASTQSVNEDASQMVVENESRKRKSENYEEFDEQEALNTLV